MYQSLMMRHDPYSMVKSRLYTGEFMNINIYDNDGDNLNMGVRVIMINDTFVCRMACEMINDYTNILSSMMLDHSTLIIDHLHKLIKLLIFRFDPLMDDEHGERIVILNDERRMRNRISLVRCEIMEGNIRKIIRNQSNCVAHLVVCELSENERRTQLLESEICNREYMCRIIIMNEEYHEINSDTNCQINCANLIRMESEYRSILEWYRCQFMEYSMFMLYIKIEERSEFRIILPTGLAKKNKRAKRKKLHKKNRESKMSSNLGYLCIIQIDNILKIGDLQNSTHDSYLKSSWNLLSSGEMITSNDGYVDMYRGNHEYANILTTRSKMPKMIPLMEPSDLVSMLTNVNLSQCVPDSDANTQWIFVKLIQEVQSTFIMMWNLRCNELFDLRHEYLTFHVWNDSPTKYIKLSRNCIEDAERMLRCTIRLNYMYYTTCDKVHDSLINDGICSTHGLYKDSYINWEHLGHDTLAYMAQSVKSGMCSLHISLIFSQATKRLQYGQYIVDDARYFEILVITVHAIKMISIDDYEFKMLFNVMLDSCRYGHVENLCIMFMENDNETMVSNICSEYIQRMYD